MLGRPPGRVLRATTNEGIGFAIRYPESGSLDLPYQEMTVWIKDSDTFFFYEKVHATNGSDYSLRYEPTTGTPYALSAYAVIPVGTAYRDGTWRELARDLSADLQSVFGVGVETVQWMAKGRRFCLNDLVIRTWARTQPSVILAVRSSVLVSSLPSKGR